MVAMLPGGPAVTIDRPPPPAAPESTHHHDRPGQSPVAGQIPSPPTAMTLPIPVVQAVPGGLAGRELA